MTPFEFHGGLYVVAGYPGADWAANARAAGAGTLSRAGGHGKYIAELTAQEAGLGAGGNAVHRQPRQRPQSLRPRLHAVRGACTLAR